MTAAVTRDPQQVIEELRLRLEEAEMTLEAIRSGEVDSLLVEGPDGPRVYALEGASNSYRTLVEAMSEGAATLSEAGAILYCNRKFAKMLDVPLHQVMGGSIHDCVMPRDRRMLEALLLRAAAVEAGESKGELSLRTRAGSGLPAHLSICSLDDGGQRVLCLVATDLSEQKRNEEIVASERLARSVLEQVSEAMVVCDVHGQIIRASGACGPLCGKNPLFLRFSEAFPLELSASIPGGDVVDAVLRGAVLRAAPATLCRPDGSRASLLVSATALRATDGELAGCVVGLVDVTEMRRAEQALREREERLAVTLRSIGDGVIATDAEGRVTVVNGVAEELTGWRAEEAVGRPMDEVFHIINEATRQPGVNPVGRVLREGVVAGLANHTVLVARDGTERPIADSAAPIRDSDARIMGVVLVFRDQTDERRAARALHEANEQLREADRRKDEFLGMLSHELRNPLAPIRNSVFVLQHARAGSEQATRACQVIERQAEHLTRIVDDLLDVNRIARGRIELRRARIDLRELVLRAADDFRPMMAAHGVKLLVAVPAAAAAADGDATRIAQVLGNLLQNAAKFTRSGDEVALSLTSTGAQAEIRVRDTGAGIEPALLPRVFDAFVQGERTLARSSGGLGLGLSLVKGLTELHGGSVRVESAGVGKGAEFVVALPLAPVAAVEAPIRAATQRGASRRRVLVVDDNHDAARSLADLVELLGHTAEVAHDGPTAVEMARANLPDAVLCDLGLPGMSGYEVARALRACASGMQLFALSGYAQAEDVQRAIEAGFDAHLAKPASPEAIERLLAQVTVPAGPGCGPR